MPEGQTTDACEKSKTACPFGAQIAVMQENARRTDHFLFGNGAKGFVEEMRENYHTLYGRVDEVYLVLIEMRKEQRSGGDDSQPPPMQSGIVIGHGKKGWQIWIGGATILAIAMALGGFLARLVLGA